MICKFRAAVPAVVFLLTACTSVSSQGGSGVSEAKSASDKKTEILERYDVDFSENTRWINLNVTAPPHTDVNNIEAFYSVVDEQCPDEVRQGQMRHFLEFEFLKDSEAGRVYTKKVPLDGGGLCKWRLSKLDFGLAYTSVEHLELGDDYKIGPGSGVTVYLHSNENLSYEEGDSVSYSPEFYVGYRNIESTGSGEAYQLGGDYSGKWVNFMTPLNQAKVFYINTDLIIDEYNVAFSPKLIESKRAFFQALGKLNVDRTISTIYYIDGEKVMKTKRHPSYSFLRNPKHYIFSGKYDHY